jgi:alkylation response protein AidB-like acyl-CoA dehydrogenase
MDFDWSPEEKAFREEVRSFIEKEATPEVRGSLFINTPERVAFVDKMAEKGWLGLGFPEEYGGSPQPIPSAKYILNCELDRADCPIVGKNIGTVASTIFHVASEEMKKEWLPKIFNNEGQWSITYSEPEAGTDIGNLSTKCEDMGDHWLINGMKHYITSAHFARWHWMAVRTDPDAPKHKGISIILVDSDSPGITMSPMWCVGTTTAERTNQVFFDNVKVPKDRIVGEVNKGFYYLMQALDYERYAMISGSQHNRRFLEILNYLKSVEYGGEKPLVDDPVSRRQMARMASRLEVGNMLEMLCNCISLERVPSAEAGMSKAWGSCMHDESCQLATEIMGPYGFLGAGGEYAGLNGYINEEYLMGGHVRVAAGGVDTSMSIIARRLLGLPNALEAPKPMKNK